MHKDAGWRNEARELLGPGKGYPEYNVDCPKCGGDRFYYNLDTHKGTCHKGSCGFSVRSFFSLVRTLERLNRSRVPGLNWETEGKKADTLMHGEAVPVKEDSFCYNYCNHRGMTDQEMARVSVWSFPAKRTIVLPVDNIKYGGESPYVRYLNPKSKIRWRGATGFERNHHLFGAQFIPRDRRVCLMVEGIFDVITPGLLGYAVATLGSAISDDVLNYVQRRFKTVWIWPDNDEGGDKFAKTLIDALTYRQIKVINLGERIYRGRGNKDPGEFDRAGPIPRNIRRVYNKLHERIKI